MGRRRQRHPDGVARADVATGYLVQLYQPLLAGRRFLISFQTVAEIRFGARRREWGAARMARLVEQLSRAEVVWPGPALLATYVVPLVSHDGIFRDVPGLVLETALRG